MGEGVSGLRGARGAAAEARAAVWAEARAPGGLLASEGRAAGLADEAAEARGAARSADDTMPTSPDEARARIDDVDPSPPARREASVSESGRLDSSELTPQQAADEVAHVRDHPELIEGTAPNRRARIGDHEIREAPSPGRAGISCARHSNGGLPVPCPTPMGGGASAAEVTLNRLQRARVRRLGERLHEHGLGWEDVGLADEAAVAEYFAAHANPNDAIAALEARARRAIDIRASHAAAGRTHATHAEEGGLAPGSPEGRAVRVEERPTVPEGQRLPRATETPDASYGGQWGGERGNSEWFSDVQAVNDITGYEPIRFVGGEPVFLPWAEERAIIRMTGVDHVDFAAADRSLLRQYPGRWRNQTEVANWRSSNRLTWHHEPDLETMTLVPTDLHGNVPHIGGASPARGGAVPDRAAPFETSPL